MATELYVGNQLVKDVFSGGSRVAAIYKGSTLIYSKYKNGDVLFNSSTAGTYSLNILVNGIYEVYVVGGGTGGNGGRVGSRFYTEYAFTGSSGSGFVGQVRLTAGTYSIIVGAGSNSNHGSNTTNKDVTTPNGGNSSIGNAVIAYGGVGGYFKGSQGTTKSFANIDKRACAGGPVPVINVPIISTTVNSRGNNGPLIETTGETWGGASVYGSYGKGGNVNPMDWSDGGTNGFVKIIYRGV